MKIFKAASALIIALPTGAADYTESYRSILQVIYASKYSENIQMTQKIKIYCSFRLDTEYTKLSFF